MDSHAREGGTLVERYRGLTRVGADAAGDRYHATLMDGTAVNVVSVAPALAAQIRDRAQFFDTLRRAAAVPQPVLAAPVAWGRTPDGAFHCAFPRLDDETLRGVRAPAEVAAIGSQLANALSAAHARGIVHGSITRDRVSPDTVHPGLGLFGLHAALFAAGVPARALADALCPPPYGSPEQSEGAPPEPSSDVYSLGACLYELLTGKPPFGGRTTSFVMAAVLTEESDVSAHSAVVDAVLRAIERAPDDRWPSAGALADALADALAAATAVRGERRDAPAGILSAIRAIFHRKWFPARRSRE